MFTEILERLSALETRNNLLEKENACLKEQIEELRAGTKDFLTEFDKLKMLDNEKLAPLKEDSAYLKEKTEELRAGFYSRFKKFETTRVILEKENASLKERVGQLETCIRHFQDHAGPIIIGLAGGLAGDIPVVLPNINVCSEEICNIFSRTPGLFFVDKLSLLTNLTRLDLFWLKTIVSYPAQIYFGESHLIFDRRQYLIGNGYCSLATPVELQKLLSKYNIELWDGDKIFSA